MPVYAAALPTSSVLKFSDLLNASGGFSGNPLLRAIQPPASSVRTHTLWLSEKSWSHALSLRFLFPCSLRLTLLS